MKIKFFIWLPMVLFGSLQAGIDNKGLIIPFAEVGVYMYAANECYNKLLPNEKNFRKRLYWLDQYNPYYFLLDSFQDDFDYCIAVLTDHIKVLENKIAQQASKFKSMAMLRGIVFSGLSTLCGAGAYQSYKTKDNYSVWGSSYNAIDSVVWLGITTAMFAATAGTQFYKVYCYSERLIARLERDKRILDVLKREKVARSLQE
jgi:hypothetical protein